MNIEDVKNKALEYGFSEVMAVSASVFSGWKRYTAEHPDVHWDGLCADPLQYMPDASCLLLLIKAYEPYQRKNDGEAELDAYYPASQSAYLAGKKVAAWLQKCGFKADDRQDFPVKQAMLRTGIAHYGRNCLISIPKYGTRFCVQTILTDAPLPSIEIDPKDTLSDMCVNCGLCMRACPTGALRGDATLDTNKCLRALSYSEPVPEDKRALLGGSMLGCDICQRVCPRNADIKECIIPEKVSGALKLQGLLRGETDLLSELIGRNYARPMRIRARAVIAAANLGRTDLLSEIKKVAEGDYPAAKENAKWAVQKLSSGGDVR